MDKIRKDIFRAVHEGKWISIEYKNKDEKQTSYWIGIKDIIPKTNMLIVEGMNLSTNNVCELKLHINSIIMSEIIEGSFMHTNESLIEEIRLHPSKFSNIFSNIVNLKVLNYLCECNRLDATPYKTEYALIEKLDLDIIGDGDYHLSPKQFALIVKHFQYNADKKYNTAHKIKQLCLNVISVRTKRGLYVLAYKKLFLDVKNKSLKVNNDVTICREFTINGNKQSMGQFLDAEELTLLGDFEGNCEKIKDIITKNNSQSRL